MNDNPDAIDWSAGAPRSPRFDDTYFSAEDGLGESRAVFLAGCGLPDAWVERRHFTVAELGFGTGLNLLALLQLWADARPAGGRLHMMSVEAYPMSRDDAARALGRWPELAELAEPLLTAWPDGRRGWRRIVWPHLGATLDLAIAEAADALSDWTGRADAWFLDGFAPSRNPEMWRDGVLDLVAARSAPGARAASFTVAGAVRRGLEARGFAVERAPGFGRKKQRLEACRSGQAPMTRSGSRVAILGAGIAGAAVARAFHRLGVPARVFDPGGAGAGASGNAAALVTPRLDAGFGPAAILHAQAFAHAVQIYRQETPDALIGEDVLQLETNPRDAARFDKIVGWDGFATGALVRLDADGAAQNLAESTAPGAIAYRDALVIEPAAVLAGWLDGAATTSSVARLEHTDGGWRLLDQDDGLIAEADLVVVAMGHRSTTLTGLPLQPVRGQASVAMIPFTGLAAAWGGYAIPTRVGTLFGATHVRGNDQSEVTEADHQQNLAYLAQGRPDLAAQLADRPLDGRAAIRAATPDHLPIAGAVPGMTGVFVLSGLGGRGFTLAPILAEALAAEALGLGGPLPTSLWRLVDPARVAPKV